MKAKPDISSQGDARTCRITRAGLLWAAERGLDVNWLANRMLEGPTQLEYARVAAPAFMKYERVRASALAEYERVVTPALAKYQRASALALADVLDLG